MERDKELYERQVKVVDAQIDRLVYDLYGVTEEEIKVVEGKMSESKNLETSAIITKYPNIAQIFTEEWFESEFSREKEDMHLLARQFTYDEEDRISLHLIDHLEEYLATMQDEIKRKGKHFSDRLRKRDFYRSTSAEIEIASLFKNMGFRQVELEPPIPDSGKTGDIKIRDDETEIFIEVSTKEGPEINYIPDFGQEIKGGPFKFQSPKIYKDKIERKSLQLSEFHPGIIALYLDPSCIPERRNIRKALYDGTVWRTNGEVVCLEKGESAMDNTIISALLLYSHCFSDGCKIDKELYLNPKAKNPISESIITKFRDNGIKIKKEPIELERYSP